MSIQPTVGRMIWYNPHPDDEAIYSPRQVLAAIVAGVNFTGSVNLSVFAADGSGPHARQDVPIFEGESAPSPPGSAQWMPYQKGQAAKTEQLEKAVVDFRGPVSQTSDLPPGQYIGLTR